MSLKSLNVSSISPLTYLTILPQFFFHLAIGHESSFGVYWYRISSVLTFISAFFLSVFAIDRIVSRISLRIDVLRVHLQRVGRVGILVSRFHNSEDSCSCDVWPYCLQVFNARKS